MTIPWTDKELEEMEARCDEASDGPWDMWAGIGYPKSWAEFLDVKTDGVAWPITIEGLQSEEALCLCRTSADQAFITRARTDLPRLIVALRESRAEVGRLREAIVKALDAMGYDDDLEGYGILQAALEESK